MTDLICKDPYITFQEIIDVLELCEWADNSGTTLTKYSTDWIYPTKAKSSGPVDTDYTDYLRDASSNYYIEPITNLYTMRTVSKTAGIQPLMAPVNVYDNYNFYVRRQTPPSETIIDQDTVKISKIQDVCSYCKK